MNIHKQEVDLALRATLLDAIEEVKGANVRMQVEEADTWPPEIDSLDLLEILLLLDTRSGWSTDPQLLPSSFTTFDEIVDRLAAIHAA